MFFNRKTFLFVYCMLSVWVSDIMYVSEGKPNDDLHSLMMHRTMTNLKEETEIPIGYQNPYEIDEDVVDDERVYRGNDTGKTRSQIILLRWPKTGMPIFYADNYSPREECYIKLAIERLRTYSCIPLKLFKVEESCAEVGHIEDCLMRNKTAWNKTRILEEFGSKSDLKDHAVINKEGRSGKLGCRSFIGRLGSKQIIRLSSTCFSNGMGTVIHETLHALGYAHEHTRQDRDDHVIILTDNISSSGKKNFVKTNKRHFRDFGPYDFYSLMHYSSFASSKNRMQTIKLKNESAGVEYNRIGQRVDLTLTDKAKVRAVTRCPGKTYDEHLAAVIEVDKANQDKIKEKAEECRLLNNKSRN